MYVISEAAAHPRLDPRDATNVRVRVLSRTDTTATVQIEDCGVLLRRGAVYTVPVAALQRRR